MRDEEGLGAMEERAGLRLIKTWQIGQIAPVVVVEYMLKNVEKERGSESGVQEEQKQQGKKVMETEQTVFSGHKNRADAAITKGVKDEHVVVYGHRETDNTWTNRSEASSHRTGLYV
jgi:hypothetical protein